MHILCSSINLVCAMALPVLLASARPHKSIKQLTLSGTNDGDLGPNDSNAKPYRTATITRINDSNDWQVAVWYPYEFAIARQLEDHQTWLQEVQNNNEGGTLFAAGYDDETPPGWWVIIGEGVDAERLSETSD